MNNAEVFEDRKKDWIKLYRELLDSPIFQDAELLKVWMWILLKANYKKRKSIFNKQVIELKPGQLIVGRKSAASKLNISESKFYRAMKTLQKLGSIEQQTNSMFTVVTVCNWEVFQDSDCFCEQETEQPTNSQRTANEQPANTPKEGKESKNSKNLLEKENTPTEWKRKRFIPPTVDEVLAYCLERGNGIDAAHFVDHYTAIGWRIGKQNMKDWKAAVRTWEKNNAERRSADCKGRTTSSRKNGTDFLLSSIMEDLNAESGSEGMHVSSKTTLAELPDPTE